jgi:hypothetical protein
VVRAAEAYGDPGKDNGVTVRFGDPGGGDTGLTTHDIETDLKNPIGMRAKELVTLREGMTGTDLEVAISHEGSHVADAQDFVNSITATKADYSKNLTKYATETRAYLVTNSVLSSANEKHTYDCGIVATCELGAKARDVAGSIDRILARSPYNVTQKNPGAHLYPAFTPPPPTGTTPH